MIDEVGLTALAAVFCPAGHAFSHSIFNASWGPAHELAHALLASPAERKKRRYGLRGDARGLRAEAAATWISTTTHHRMGNYRLVNHERVATSDEVLAIPHSALISYLQQRRCAVIPRSLPGWVRWCQARALKPVSLRTAARRLATRSLPMWAAGRQALHQETLALIKLIYRVGADASLLKRRPPP